MLTTLPTGFLSHQHLCVQKPSLMKSMPFLTPASVCHQPPLHLFLMTSLLLLDDPYRWSFLKAPTVAPLFLDVSTLSNKETNDAYIFVNSCGADHKATRAFVSLHPLNLGLLCILWRGGATVSRPFVAFVINPKFYVLSEGSLEDALIPARSFSGILK